MDPAAGARAQILFRAYGRLVAFVRIVEAPGEFFDVNGLQREDTVISDPAREPVMERAMPADAVPGSTIPEDSEAEVLLQDGTWIYAQVIGQRKDRRGRWCVGIRWYASSAVGGREGWYLYDPRFARRVN